MRLNSRLAVMLILLASLLSSTPALASTTTWTTKMSMPTARLELAVTTAGNGKAYAIGGIAPPGGSLVSAVEEFDPTTNTWSTKAALPTPRYGLGAAGTSNGKIYAIGGSNGRALGIVEEYDPATNTWATRTSMPTPRASLGVVTANNGKIYAIGGYNSAIIANHGILGTVEEYDPQTNTWATRANMPTVREFVAVAAASNGKIYAIGGHSVDSQGNGSFVAAVEEYDPITDTWTARANMITSRAGSAAVGATNGKIYAIGGSIGNIGTFGVLSTVEEYDPSTDTWVNQASMPTGRIFLGATLANNGKIYAIGGRDSSSELATVEEMTIVEPNSSPVAGNDSYSTNEDTPLIIGTPGVLGNDSDVDGDSLTAALVNGPGHGTLNLNADGAFSYTPHTNYNGSDSFTYKANDGTVDSNEATVIITVAAVNDPPVAGADSTSTNEDTALTFPASDLLANDAAGPADESGQTLSIVAVGTTANTHGTVSLSNSTVTYTPAADFNGSANFTYTVCDNGNSSQCAPGMVNVTVNPINDAPSFIKGTDPVIVSEDSGAYSASWATAISAGPANESGQALTFHITNNTNLGLFSAGPALAPDGSLTFTPASNAYGNATITIVLKDDGGTASGGVDSSQPQTFVIQVMPMNDLPVAVNDLRTVSKNSTITIAVLDNDSDVDGDSLTVTSVPQTTSQRGTVITNGTTVTYSPKNGFTGVDSFTYSISDGQGGTATATVTVIVSK